MSRGGTLHGMVGEVDPGIHACGDVPVATEADELGEPPDNGGRLIA